MKSVSRFAFTRVALATGVVVSAAIMPRGRGARAATLQPIQVKTPRYVAVFDPRRGGLLRSLRPVGAKRDLVQNMQIYTDYGLYPERGYVGTRGVVPAKFQQTVRKGVPVIAVEGVLTGKPAAGRPLTRYRIEYDCRPDGSLHVRAGLRPGLEKKADGNAFLALQWDVPGLTEFTVRTAKGLVRRRYLTAADQRHRAYQARDLPLDPLHPDLSFWTDTGARLRIEHLKGSGVPLLTGPVIHGHAVFLCWLDGPGRPVQAGKWGWIEFDLVFDSLAASP